MAGEDEFADVDPPRRQFDSDGTLSYEDGTVIALAPAVERTDEVLAALVADVLVEGPYRHGDFLELPMPVWLVRDEETGDVFRVSIRDGTVQLHLLPETGPAGLRRLRDRLAARTGSEWTVTDR